MKLSAKELQTILLEGESYTVEFKESVDKSLPTEVCAFANASGGIIFIGVDDNGCVVGTDTSNVARSRLQDTINQIEPRLDVTVEIYNKNIFAINVPCGPDKPYSCSKGFYLRSGPNSQKLDRNSILDFFKNEGSIRYDEIVCNNLPLDDGRFNEVAFKRYIKTAKISGVIDRELLLKNLKCAGEQDGELCYTNAGVLFFRDNTDDVDFRHTGVVCALYKGTDKATVLDVKELTDDLVSNVDNAMIFIRSHLRMEYHIKSVQRQNVPELPEEALREAVINAVCHRDYFEKGARVMIEIYDDRVEIVSPGGICKGITRENFGKTSVARNPNIAAMLCRIGYIEQMGTGIARMRKAMAEYGLEEPQFEINGFFRVIFKRNEGGNAGEEQAITGNKQAIEANGEAITGNREAIAGNKQAIGKDNKTLAVFKYITAHDETTSAELMEQFSLSRSRIGYILRDLAADGFIEKIGDKRHTYYKPINQ